MLHGSSGRFYIGSTTDLYRRLAQHQQGNTYSTRRLCLPLELVAAKQLDSLPEARKLERQAKRKKNPRLALPPLAQAQAGAIHAKQTDVSASLADLRLPLFYLLVFLSGCRLFAGMSNSQNTGVEVPPVCQPFESRKHWITTAARITRHLR